MEPNATTTLERLASWLLIPAGLGAILLSVAFLRDTLTPTVLFLGFVPLAAETVLVLGLLVAHIVSESEPSDDLKVAMISLVAFVLGVAAAFSFRAGWNPSASGGFAAASVSFFVLAINRAASGQAGSRGDRRHQEMMELLQEIRDAVKGNPIGATDVPEEQIEEVTEHEDVIAEQRPEAATPGEAPAEHDPTEDIL